MVLVPLLAFFFFKQKTAYEMRISDWSSDVCSSDLRRPGAPWCQTQPARDPMTDDIAFLPATELAARIRARRLGCRELLDHMLARVERHNPGLNALVVLDAERARTRADAADAAAARGEFCGPLHGVPMTVQESYDVEGLPPP